MTIEKITQNKSGIEAVYNILTQVLYRVSVDADNDAFAKKMSKIESDFNTLITELNTMEKVANIMPKTKKDEILKDVFTKKAIALKECDTRMKLAKEVHDASFKSNIDIIQNTLKTIEFLHAPSRGVDVNILDNIQMALKGTKFEDVIKEDVFTPELRLQIKDALNQGDIELISSR